MSGEQCQTANKMKEVELKYSVIKKQRGGKNGVEKLTGTNHITEEE